MHEGWRQSRRAALTTLAMAALGAACRTPATASDGLSLDVIAERYVRLTLQLSQHQPSLVEQWLGPPAWRPGPRRPVPDLRAEIATLQQAVHAAASDPESHLRLRYLQRQVASLYLAARRLSGESMTFADEARAAFGERAAAWLTPPSESSAALEQARTILDQRLPGPGPLHDRYTAFRKAYAIAPHRLTSTLQQAMQHCRDRIRAKVALPDDEQVTLETEGRLGLAGMATYETALRSRVAIDVSGPLDVARAMWLVAHETYPGHHVQHVLGDRELVQRRGWTERALFPAFGSHLLVAEGAAEAGADLLLDGSQFDEACHAIAPTAGTPARAVADLVAVHRAVNVLDIAIVDVAKHYLDHTLDAEAAADALRVEALVPDGRPLLALIERQRTRILAYPVGRRLVRAQLAQRPSDRRWDRLMEITCTLVLPA
jgi:hypothetical protein